jgi:hypothetical protein
MELVPISLKCPILLFDWMASVIKPDFAVVAWLPQRAPRKIKTVPGLPHSQTCAPGKGLKNRSQIPE